MSTRDIENKLKELSKDNSASSWKERKDYHKKNRAWLKKSVDIALRVLDVLDARHMSQADLATKLAVSRQQVSKIVKGQENLTLETISKLEDVLGVTLTIVPENEIENSFSAKVAVETELIMAESIEVIIEEQQTQGKLSSLAQYLQEYKENTQYQGALPAGESNYAMAC